MCRVIGVTVSIYIVFLNSYNITIIFDWNNMKFGIISDTHDLLRTEVLTSLSGVDAVLHAGDISSRRILDELQQIAPVYAVRGNADKEWAEDLPAILNFELGGIHICMTHKKKDLPKDLYPFDLVVIGHSHQYSETQQGKTLIINPGSCGPRRFYQKITMSIAEKENDQITITRIDIPHTTPSPQPDPIDIRSQIEIVIREIDKGKKKNDIAEKYGIDPATAEQIARLYLTHPGVTADGIMTKMGL